MFDNRMDSIVPSIEDGLGFLPASKTGMKTGVSSFIADSAMDLINGIGDLSTAKNTKIASGQTTVSDRAGMGMTALSGAAKGAAAGSVVPGVGTLIGAGVGALTGIITGAANKKKEKAEFRQIEDITKKKYNKLNLMENIDPAGTEGVFYAEGGGMLPDLGGPGKRKKRRGLDEVVSSTYGTSGIIGEFGNTNRPTTEQALKNMASYMQNNNWITSNVYHPKFSHLAINEKSIKDIPVAEDGGQFAEGDSEQPTMVDIELGEILVDPISLDIVREYSNKNRYKPHAKNSMHEPVGNFTVMKPNQIVISKKYAERYKNGDSLSRKSIIMEILKNQRNEGTPMVSAPGGNVPQAKGGYSRGPGPSAVALKSLYKSLKAFDDKNLGGTGDYSSYAGTPNATTPIMEASAIPSIEDGMGILENSQPELLPAPGRSRTGKSLVTATDVARAANFIPTAFGMASASRDEKVTYDENNQMEKAKSYISSLETNPSIEASRRAINNAAANQIKTLNNFNSPSVRAEAASRAGDVIDAEGKLIQEATNFAMDARNKKKAALAELEVNQGNMRYNARTALRDTIAQNAAAKTRVIQAGLSEGVRNFGAQVMDDNRLRSLNTMLQFYKVGKDGSLEDNKKFGEAVAEIIGGVGFNPEDLALDGVNETTLRNRNGVPSGSRTTKRYKSKKMRNG
jgi:uncharacterized membrane protein